MTAAPTVRARHAAVLTSVALLALAASARADVKLQNAWLRPAYAGQPRAQLYVDIASTEALTLVGARSPAASAANLVRVEIDTDPDGKVVAAIPVAANVETRLAYRGSHVQLVDIRRDLTPGARVAFELDFNDARGKRRTIAGEALVRGLTARRPQIAAEPSPKR